jgi:tryptophanyl-tRNA synthetase
MVDLLCKENETVLEVEECSMNQFSVSEEEEEHVRLLIQKEIAFGFKKDENFLFEDSVKRARLNAIYWILKVSFIDPFFLLLFLILIQLH